MNHIKSDKSEMQALNQILKMEKSSLQAITLILFDDG